MKRFARAARQVPVHRRLVVLSAAFVAVLIAATGALAWHGFSSATTTSATFTATTVGNSQSATCTAGTDSIQITDAVFTGTATSTDTHLNGPITIYAKSVYDATTKAGTVSGFATIGSGGSGFQGRLITVNNNGELQGLLVGWEDGVGSFIGNVSAPFTATGGFAATGSIGTGTGTNSAIVSASSCQPMFNQQGHDDNNQGGFSDHFQGGGSFTNFGGGFNSLFSHHEDSQH